MKDTVFVLDIGTRSVMALLASWQKGEMVIEKMIYKEHSTRAMLDGQIHHVEEVVQLVGELVQEMRQITGQQLKKVAVAAAGRALKTVKGSAIFKHPVSVVFSKEEILALELQAVQKAQRELPKNQNNIPLSQQYYCVGYSVVQQCLDQIKIGSLVGQKGETAQIEVIATFLPRIVVDSLQTVVENLGLEVESITLEPIAVANLILNPAMRRLNLVLVDIGAGTSDIAVCEGDAISAFGMVPMAGDEITETLSDQYLLDFNSAEEVKRQLNTTAQKLNMVNVLGMEESYSVEEIRKNVQPCVEVLAATIATRILALNNKAPQALFLVGGGSLTPGLGKKLAEALNIPWNRVAVQQAGKLTHICNLPVEFSGPNYITVLAIAYTALTCPTMGFISVNINGIPVRMLNMAQNNVAGALLAGGYNLKEIYGRPGMALTCEINGKLYTVPGKEGKPGQILLNDQPTEFSAKVKQGDNICFIPGKKGKNASITFGELLNDMVSYCTVNGQKVELSPVIRVQGKIMSLQDLVPDGCNIYLETCYTIAQVLKELELVNNDEYVLLNGSKITLAEMAVITKNGKKADFKDTIYFGDTIIFEPCREIYIKDFIPDEALIYTEIMVNGKSVHLNSLQVWVNKTRIDPRKSISLKPGDVIEYKSAGFQHRPILVDIFNELDISTEPPPGKSKLVILLNNEEREYTYPLKQGDKIQIKWI